MASASVFVPGQLVQVTDRFFIDGEKLLLWNVPAGFSSVPGEEVRAIGWLVTGEVALVIARGTTKSGDVYVLGPHGSGWAPAAFLHAVQNG